MKSMFSLIIPWSVILCLLRDSVDRPLRPYLIVPCKYCASCFNDTQWQGARSFGGLFRRDPAVYTSGLVLVFPKSTSHSTFRHNKCCMCCFFESAMGTLLFKRVVTLITVSNPICFVLYWTIRLAVGCTHFSKARFWCYYSPLVYKRHKRYTAISLPCKLLSNPLFCCNNKVPATNGKNSAKRHL